MTFSFVVNSRSEIEIATKVKGSSLYFTCQEFSRYGQHCFQETFALAQFAQSLGFDCFLVWDLILTQSQFNQSVQLLENFDLSPFKGFQVQDPGVVRYIKHHLADKKIILLCEMNHKNLDSLKTWKAYLGEQLLKVMVSPELSLKSLRALNDGTIPLEVSILGQILLFYTPRKLLSALSVDEKKQIKQSLKAIGESEESPHKGFPLLENNHGTFMFHLKDLFLLDELENLKDFSLYINLSHLNNPHLLSKVVEFVLTQKGQALDELKNHYPHKVTKGFFNVNKTDVLFPKLKNIRLNRYKENYLGEVVDVIKGKYLVVKVGAMTLQKHQKISFISPEGINKELYLDRIYNLDFDEVCSISNELCLIPYVAKMTAKSCFYLTS